MRRIILTLVSAAALAAAVCARETLPMPGELPAKAAPETPVLGGLALEVLENLLPVPGNAGSRISFAVVEGDAPGGASSSPMDDMASWQLQILDSGGKKVSFLQGRGEPPPPVLSWAGVSTGGGQLPGGFYSARLVWKDKADKVYTAPAVRFSLFSQLQMPKFAELKLDFRFAGGFPSL